MCDRLQTDLVYDKNIQKVLAVCEFCCDKILDRGNPEYVEFCMNCGCGVGIN